jgi:hypothetical protein
MVNNGANLKKKDANGASILEQAKGDLELHAELERMLREQPKRLSLSDTLRRSSGSSWSFLKRGGKRSPRISSP